MYCKALHEVPGQPAGKDIVLLLALYREITLTQRASGEDQHFHQEVRNNLDCYSASMKSTI